MKKTIIILLALLMIPAVAGYDWDDVTHAWLFDNEIQTNTLDIVGSRNLTPDPTHANYVPGLFYDAMDIEGNGLGGASNGIRFESNSWHNSDFSGDWTIDGWVHFNISQSLNRILNFEDKISLMLLSSGGNASVRFVVGGTDQTNLSIRIFSGEEGFYHIALVKNGTVCKGYVNGTQMTKGTACGLSDVDSLSKIAGFGEDDNGGNDASMTFDEWHYWNASLSENDIYTIWSTQEKYPYNTTFNLTINDEKSNKPVGEKIKIEFISEDNNAYQFEVESTASISFYNFTSSNYTIRYYSENYSKRSYYTSLNRLIDQSFMLYLLNQSYSSNITISIYDQNTGLPVNDAKLILLRYFPDESIYKTVQMAKTNFNGKASLNVELYNEYYKILTYVGDELVAETDNFYITQYTYDIIVNLDTPLGDKFKKSEGVYHNISTVNNATGWHFKFLYSDPSGTLSRACMETTRIKYSDIEVINSTCVTSSSGGIYHQIKNISGRTYQAVASFYFSNPPQVVDQESKRFYSPQNLGRGGAWGIWLFTAVFALMGIWSIEIAVILVTIPQLFGTYMGLINIQPWASISLLLLGIILSVIIGRGRQQ